MVKGDPAVKFENLLPYYNGAYYATVAIKGRLAAAGQVEAAREVYRLSGDGHRVSRSNQGDRETPGRSKFVIQIFRRPSIAELSR